MVDVVVSAEAEEYVAARGGTAYVRAHRHRCCSGPLTVLDITTGAPSDALGFTPVGAGDLSVRYDGDPGAGPHVLTIELRGVVRRRLVASWDGCAFRP
jgi:hypothetical protein